jgi:hypothetical protein
MSLKNNLYTIEVHDNLLPVSAGTRVWEYLSQQKWHVKWKEIPAIPSRIDRYYPKDGKPWLTTTPSFPNCHSFHRCCLGIEESDLRENHPLIATLWDMINKGLGNEYELTGYPEDMFDEEYSKQRGTEGWRCYVNGMFGQANTGQWGPHRDTPDLDDDSSATILYVVNPEWYPRWGAELVYFPEDPEGISGDYQQFNVGKHGQQRGFNIGWPDLGQIVSPVPGRVIVQDGRALHTTKTPCTGIDSTPNWKIAFRARRKTPWSES